MTSIVTAACTVAALLTAGQAGASTSPTTASTGRAAAAAAAGCTPAQSGAAVPTTSSGTQAVREMMGVAQTMAVPLRGKIIAVMVMSQESSIRNLANDGSSPQVSWPSPGRNYWLSVTKLSLKYPHDKFGTKDGAHDTDSIGLYQQRPSSGWGNYGNSSGTTDPEGVVQRLLDPRWEAMAFFGGPMSAAPTSGLLDIPGWESMALTDAAEAVQRSTQGDLYAKWATPATDAVNKNLDAPAVALPWFPGGGGDALACTSIPSDPALGEAGRNPLGSLDSATIQGTGIRVSGWAFDPDAINGAVSIRVADTGPSGNTRYVDGIANLSRDDVQQAFNVVGQFGYGITVPAVASGVHAVCVSATNIGRGTGDPQFGCVTVVAGPLGACGGNPTDPVPSGVGAARTDSTVTVAVRGADDGVFIQSIGSGGFQSLGGRIRYGPAVTSWGDDRLDVFAVGTDGGLYHNAGSANGRWNGWESLGGVLTASPAALSFDPNSLDVYGRGTDGRLWSIGWTGSVWSSWRPLGGALNSGPGAAADPDSHRAAVGVRDADGNLRELRFGISGPGAFLAAGTTLCSAPAYAARAGDGDSLTLAYRTKDGSLTVSGRSIGGVATSAPALVLDQTGSGVWTFTRGLDGALWGYHGAPGAGSWTSLGGRLN